MFDNLGFNPVLYFKLSISPAPATQLGDQTADCLGLVTDISCLTPTLYSIYHGEEDTCVFTKPRHVRLEDQHVYLSDFLLQINVAH